MTEKWELFSHKADMGIRGIGPTYAKAFEQGALALTGVVIEPGNVKDELTIPISCVSPKIEILFYDWINELVFEMACRQIIFGRFNVMITNKEDGQFNLEGKAWGEKIRTDYESAIEIKGATFMELKAEPYNEKGCLVQCVVDV